MLLWTLFGAFLSALVLPAATFPQSADSSSGGTFSGKMSFYDTYYPTQNASCGPSVDPESNAVALNQAQWDNKVHCFEEVVITYSGQHQTATILELCPGCTQGALDLTRGLFTKFAPEASGTFTAEWNFNGKGGSTTSESSTATTIPVSGTSQALSSVTGY